MLERARQVKEAKLCQISPRYMMTRYCQIPDAITGTPRPFDLFPYQERLLPRFRREILMVLKSRQIGFSTLIECLFLCLAMTREAIKLFIIHRTGDDSKDRMRELRAVYERTPSWLKDQCYRVTNDHQTEITFEGGGLIKAFGSKQPVRSRTAQGLFFDEWGLYDDPASAWAAARPALHSDAMLIFGSSSPGPGTFFEAQWLLARKGELKNVAPVFLSWKENPAHDQEWYDDQRAEWVKSNQPISKFCAEHPDNEDDAFVVAHNAVFDKTVLDKQPVREPLEVGEILTESTVSGPKVRFVAHPQGNLRVWEHPVPGDSYVMGVDTGGGNPDDDASCISVFHASGFMVAQWHGREAPVKFGANRALAIGRYYNVALAVVEVNNEGAVTQQELERESYANMYQRRDETQFIHTGQAWRWGFQTNKASKPIAVAHLRNFLADGFMVMRCSETVMEHRRFSRKDNGAMEGNPDDRVASCFLAAAGIRFLEENAVPASDAFRAPPGSIDELLQQFAEQDARQGPAPLVSTVHAQTARRLGP